MAQNIYDNAQFYAGYSQILRSREGLNGAPEWPRLMSMLPSLKGTRVLDLGCGFGAFDRWALDNGAERVTAVDLSANMLNQARARSQGYAIRYEQADLETYSPEAGQYDLVYSTLAMHYLSDFSGMCARIRACLVEGGSFVFSMEHPLFAARANPEWTEDAEGNRVFLVRDYLTEGERVSDWITSGIVKYHRTISTVINVLRANGLDVYDIDEWGPSTADLAAHPEWADDARRPMFLLVAARTAQSSAPKQSRN